jgi:hypothetical protein
MRAVIIIILLVFPCFINAQILFNQTDSIGRKQGSWVWIPDSINLLNNSEDFILNKPEIVLDCFIKYSNDSIKKLIYDSVITVHASYIDGLLHGKVFYYLDNKYIVATADYYYGELNGIVVNYRGTIEDISSISTFTNGKKHGFDIYLYLYAKSISVQYFVNDVSYFVLDYGLYNTHMNLTDKQGRFKDGKHLFPLSDGYYAIAKYKKGKIVSYKIVCSKDNIILDQTKKGGSRPYYWGYIIKLTSKKDETRFERWMRRKF